MTIKKNYFKTFSAQIKTICTLYRVLYSPVMLPMVLKEKVLLMGSSLFFLWSVFIFFIFKSFV